MENIEQSNWWMYLEEPMRYLARESFTLLNQEKARVGSGERPHHDYSYIVFPIAKAFEGFLKKLFLDLGFISNKQYKGDRFRIGRALNPNLPKRLQWDWVYAKLAGYCEGEELPMKLWNTWKNARNRIFHYFPDSHEFVTLSQAEELVGEIVGTMEEALAGGRVAVLDR